MKKLFLILLMLAVTVLTFGQTAADSTFASSIHEIFGISFDAVLWIILIISGLIGHFAVGNKWASVLLWIQKIAQLIVDAITWFNEKTNKGQKK